MVVTVWVGKAAIGESKPRHATGTLVHSEVAKLNSEARQSSQHYQQRIDPLAIHQLDSDQALLLEEMRKDGARPVTLVSTLARSPALLKQVNRMAVVFQSCSIKPAERELVILCVAAFCRSEYLFAEHTPISAKVGLTQVDLELLWRRSLSPSWNERQTGLVSFVTDLLAKDSISDESWKAAPFRDDPMRMIELISLIGFYRMIAGLTNAVRMELHDFEYKVPS